MSDDPRKGYTSASSAQEDLNCPGRHLAQEAVRRAPGFVEKPREQTELGNLVHDALCGLFPVPDLSLPAREIFDECREQEKRLLIDYFGEQPPAPVRVARKERLWVRFSKTEGGVAKEYGHSGEPDVLFRCGTKALILDYKTGRIEVEESPSNLQLRDYAVLVSGNLTLLDQIATAIIQPHVCDNPKTCEYDREALEKARVEMYERVAASWQANAPRHAGEPQCTYCLAKHSCPTYQQWAGAAMPMLKALDVPLTSWTPEQLASAAAALGPAQKFLDDIKEFIKEGLKTNPGFCPGFFLKPGNKVETIVDPQKCLDRFTVMGGRLEDFMPAVKIAKGKLRESVAKVTGKKGKTLDKLMGEVTEGIVEVKQNEPSIARRSASEEVAQS